MSPVISSSSNLRWPRIESCFNTLHCTIAMQCSFATWLSSTFSIRFCGNIKITILARRFFFCEIKFPEHIESMYKKTIDWKIHWNFLTLKTARMMRVTFSLAESLSMSARIGITLNLFIFSASKGLNVSTQRQKISWYWTWKFTRPERTLRRVEIPSTETNANRYSSTRNIICRHRATDWMYSLFCTGKNLNFIIGNKSLEAFDIFQGLLSVVWATERKGRSRFFLDVFHISRKRKIILHFSTEQEKSKFSFSLPSRASSEEKTCNRPCDVCTTDRSPSVTRAPGNPYLLYFYIIAKNLVIA